MKKYIKRYDISEKMLFDHCKIISKNIYDDLFRKDVRAQTATAFFHPLKV